MLIREEMDNGGTEVGSASDAVLECPALPPPHSCLTVYATRIGFLQMCFFGACRHFIVVYIGLFECQYAVVDRIGQSFLNKTGWLRSGQGVISVQSCPNGKWKRAEHVYMSRKVKNARMAMVRVDYRIT